MARAQRRDAARVHFDVLSRQRGRVRAQVQWRGRRRRRERGGAGGRRRGRVRVGVGVVRVVRRDGGGSLRQRHHARGELLPVVEQQPQPGGLAAQLLLLVGQQRVPALDLVRSAAPGLRALRLLLGHGELLQLLLQLLDRVPQALERRLQQEMT